MKKRTTYLLVCFLIGLINISCNVNEQNDSLTEEEILAEKQFMDSIMLNQVGVGIRPNKDSTHINIFLNPGLKNDESFLLNFDDGEYIYDNDTTYAIFKNSPSYLMTYRPKTEKVKVFFSINEKDSIFFLDPKKHFKLMFNPWGYCTNLDWECWERCGMQFQ